MVSVVVGEQRGPPEIAGTGACAWHVRRSDPCGTIIVDGSARLVIADYS
jgi:hypothetical protein